MQGDLEWYRSESEKIPHAPLRCPYATRTVARYFQSLSLAETFGGCAMDPQLFERLQKRWAEDIIISEINETAPTVTCGDHEFSMLTNFCPEVTYDILESWPLFFCIHGLAGCGVLARQPANPLICL